MSAAPERTIAGRTRDTTCSPFESQPVPRTDQTWALAGVDPRVLRLPVVGPIRTEMRVRRAPSGSEHRSREAGPASAVGAAGTPTAIPVGVSRSVPTGR